MLHLIIYRVLQIVYYFDFAPSLVDAFHPDLRFDSFAQFVNVTNDAYFFPAYLMQSFQSIHDHIQIVAAECSKTFVNEQSIYRETLSVE